MAKVKTIMIGTRAAITAISRLIVVVIGNGVVMSNNPILLKENGGLRLCHARELLVSQIPVSTGGFELRISCIRSSYLTH